MYLESPWFCDVWVLSAFFGGTGTLRYANDTRMIGKNWVNPDSEKMHATSDKYWSLRHITGFEACVKLEILGIPAHMRMPRPLQEGPKIRNMPCKLDSRFTKPCVVLISWGSRNDRLQVESLQSGTPSYHSRMGKSHINSEWGRLQYARDSTPLS